MTQLNQHEAGEEKNVQSGDAASVNDATSVNNEVLTDREILRERRRRRMAAYGAGVKSDSDQSVNGDNDQSAENAEASEAETADAGVLNAGDARQIGGNPEQNAGSAENKSSESDGSLTDGDAASAETEMTARQKRKVERRARIAEIAAERADRAAIRRRRRTQKMLNNMKPEVRKSADDDSDDEPVVPISNFAKSVSDRRAEASQEDEVSESSGDSEQLQNDGASDGIQNFIKQKLLVLWSLVKRFAEKNPRSAVILFFTLVPALITFLYAVLIYDSMYVSKTTFTIQSNTTEKSFDFGASSLLTAGVNKDLHVVYAYIKSVDLFNDLDSELNLKEHYQHHDPVSTMPSQPTIMDIEEYWDGVTTVKIDADSDIMLMTVRTYDPEFSKLLADTVLRKIDNLVNTMNAHALEDSIKLAKREVKEAEDRVRSIAEKIRIYRDEHEYIDPKTEAGSTMGIVSTLESEIAQKKAELAEKLGYMRSNSQEIITLERKIASLENQVKELRSRISSSGKYVDQKSMSKSVAEYEKLELEYQFAQKILESVRTTLEVTRQQSLSKNKYLVKIDEPKIPDESLWPRPFKAASLVMAISFLLILGISLIVSAVMEHLGI